MLCKELYWQIPSARKATGAGSGGCFNALISHRALDASLPCERGKNKECEGRGEWCQRCGASEVDGSKALCEQPFSSCVPLLQFQHLVSE